ncbi:hypothetical protein CsSME_00044647 [Camellia sinensis var. sinensis]
MFTFMALSSPFPVIYWKHTFCHPILATHLGKIGDVKWVHVDQALSLSLLSDVVRNFIKRH